MSDAPEIETLRSPVDDDAVRFAREQIGTAQMSAWADEVSAYTMGGFGPVGPRSGNMLTLRGEVPWLTPAHRIAVLEAAIFTIKMRGA